MLLPTMRTMLPAIEVRRLFQTVLLEDRLPLAIIQKAAPVLMAQSALETGHWRSMWCFNFGNVRPGSSWPGDICQFRCNEVIGGKVVWFDPPEPGQAGYGDPRHGSSFRAFLTSLQGARKYIDFLKTRYSEAYGAALQGNAVGFVHGLKVRGYFTASEQPYVDAVVRLLVEFQKLDAADGFYSSPALPWDDLAKSTAVPSRAKDIQRALNVALAKTPGAPDQLSVDGILGAKSKAALAWAEQHYQTASIDETLKAIGVA